MNEKLFNILTNPSKMSKIISNVGEDNKKITIQNIHEFAADSMEINGFKENCNKFVGYLEHGLDVISENECIIIDMVLVKIHNIIITQLQKIGKDNFKELYKWVYGMTPIFKTILKKYKNKCGEIIKRKYNDFHSVTNYISWYRLVISDMNEKLMDFYLDLIDANKIEMDKFKKYFNQVQFTQFDLLNTYEGINKEISDIKNKIGDVNIAEIIEDLRKIKDNQKSFMANFENITNDIKIGTRQYTENKKDIEELKKNINSNKQEIELIKEKLLFGDDTKKKINNKLNKIKNKVDQFDLLSSLLISDVIDIPSLTYIVDELVETVDVTFDNMNEELFNELFNENEIAMSNENADKLREAVNEVDVYHMETITLELPDEINKVTTDLLTINDQINILDKLAVNCNKLKKNYNDTIEYINTLKKEKLATAAEISKLRKFVDENKKEELETNKRIVAIVNENKLLTNKLLQSLLMALSEQEKIRELLNQLAQSDKINFDLRQQIDNIKKKHEISHEMLLRLDDFLLVKNKAIEQELERIDSYLNIHEEEIGHLIDDIDVIINDITQSKINIMHEFENVYSGVNKLILQLNTEREKYMRMFTTGQHQINKLLESHDKLLESIINVRDGIIKRINEYKTEIENNYGKALIAIDDKLETLETEQFYLQYSLTIEKYNILGINEKLIDIEKDIEYLKEKKDEIIEKSLSKVATDELFDKINKMTLNQIESAKTKIKEEMQNANNANIESITQKVSLEINKIKDIINKKYEKLQKIVINKINDEGDTGPTGDVNAPNIILNTKIKDLESKFAAMIEKIPAYNFDDINKRVNKLIIGMSALKKEKDENEKLKEKISKMELKLEKMYKYMSFRGIDFGDLEGDIQRQKKLLLLLAQNEVGKYINNQYY